MLCDDLDGWAGGESGLEGGSRGKFLWLIHIVAQHKSTHCKAIILQFKKTFFLRGSVSVGPSVVCYTVNMLNIPKVDFAL